MQHYRLKGIRSVGEYCPLYLLYVLQSSQENQRSFKQLCNSQTKARRPTDGPACDGWMSTSPTALHWEPAVARRPYKAEQRVSGQATGAYCLWNRNLSQARWDTHKATALDRERDAALVKVTKIQDDKLTKNNVCGHGHTHTHTSFASVSSNMSCISTDFCVRPCCWWPSLRAAEFLSDIIDAHI